MPIVSVKNLVKIYANNHKALDDVNLELEEGKIYGLLGPNGAGKSTLINIIVGLMPPSSGEVTIFGAKSGDIKKYSEKLGFVPQNIAIYDNLTAYENVAFFAGIYGYKGSELKQKCKEALEFVGLSEWSKVLAKRFSGGMQRRLNIACALVNKPKMIIFDEPTVGIDPQSRNHILESIKRLNDEGSTVIYTSHYMEEVQKICDYIYIMDLGKVILHGNKEDLLNNNSDDSLLVLIDEDSIETARQVYGNMMDDSILQVRKKDIDELINELRANNIKFIEIKKKSNNLEDLFLSLTGKKLRD